MQVIGMDDTLEEKETASEEGEKKGFFGKHGDKIFLAALLVWFVLLVIGVIAEIFDIESVLDWWIWKPVGKP
jgi:hypothetical protein